MLWFNVTTYGAVGNGTTDDTTSINSAIAAFNAAGKGVLYFPHGTYKTTSGLTNITGSGIVRGDGSVDLERGDSPVSEITLNSTTDSVFTTSTEYLKFENLTIRNNAGSTPASGAGITVNALTNTQKIDYDSIDVRGFYVGIDIASGADWLMLNTTVRGPVKYAVKIQNTVNADNGDWSIIGSAFYAETYAADAAIRIETGGGGKIVSSKINEGSYPTAGNKFVRGIDLAPAGATSILLVSASSIENISGDGIHVSNANTWDNISITGNEFGLYSNTTGSAINISGQNRIAIIGNVFVQSGGGTPVAITLNTCDAVQINGNVKTGFSGGLTSLTSVTTLTNLNGTPTGTGSNPVLDTSPTIVTPTIASFANSNHTHQNSAGGGTLAEAALALTNVTTNDATTSRHGFLKLLDNVATHYMDGTGNWSTPAGSGGGVSSVAMTGDGTIFDATVSGSPITTSGTLAPALLTQTANFLLAGPTTGAAAAPTFRAMVTADIPNNIVTLAKLATQADATVLANSSGGTAVPSALAVGASQLVGRGSSGSVAAITLGAGLSMSSTTLSSTGSAVPIASGTSNPGSPATNDLFFRTDLGLLIYYDGTRWLTLTEYETLIQINGNAGTVSAVADLGFVTIPNDFAIYVTTAYGWSQTAATNNGSNFWTYAFKWRNSAGSDTSLGTFTTASDTAATGTVHKATINTALTSSALILTFRLDVKTGTPGNTTFVAPKIRYRYIIT